MDTLDETFTIATKKYDLESFNESDIYHNKINMVSSKKKNQENHVLNTSTLAINGERGRGSSASSHITVGAEAQEGRRVGAMAAKPIFLFAVLLMAVMLITSDVLVKAEEEAESGDVEGRKMFLLVLFLLTI